MSYMTNAQFKTLGKVWTELRDNDGKLSFETFEEYSQLMREFQTDKDNNNKRVREYIKERRKTDKNYARKKIDKSL